MSGGMDRRPWLIISRTEALALRDAALRSLERPNCTHPVPAALARALRVIDLELRVIDAGAFDGIEPTIDAALQREARV